MIAALETSSDLLLPVLELARTAGRAVLDIYSRGFTVDLKADDSPLTQADRAAHEILCTGLARLTPDIPVLSEESPAPTHQFDVRGRWTQLWLVDPLDGTKEFIQRNGEFTINVALIREHRPVLGVVLAPALDLAYYADERDAWRSRPFAGGPAERIRVRIPAAQPPVVAASRSHRDPSVDALLDRLREYECVSAGSALKFCWVAEGRVDFYPRLAPTSEWDTAAGQAVVERAGGRVVELSGEPLKYNMRETLLNPHFLAYGDAQRQWERLLSRA